MAQVSSTWKENLGRKGLSARRRFDLGIVLFGALLLGILMPAASLAQADIIPGQSLWKMRLGMSSQALNRVVANPPDDVRHMRGGITVEVWDNDPVLLQHGKVIQISSSNLADSTPDGISGHSSLADVRAHYKGLRHIKKWAWHQPGGTVDGQEDMYDDVSRGIAFDLLTPKDPKKHVEIISIIVHHPGRPVVLL